MVEQLISAGATVDAANKYRRGPGGFRVALGVAGDGRGLYIIFVLLWDVEWLLAVKRTFFWCRDGPLEICVKEMTKHGGT